ncbi:uncharacterized protein CXQ87_004341 [Candidozyma duobushaemuli]|uniref:non-specific serine/threonine protein kinase n=1 Tax=Candidozyma duobushaemuli TaxID=1231522 RepID=A0A2V1AGT8_9ASCO|nr:uncharacterized protein CXQ87_004341 [[Candida] duobushaemulonis]PVH16786.1 hypothetical protein CXQ87_004341 [[Candida] duobushaemulonis]
MTAAPPDAFQKGKQLQVGSHKISILKYLSSGGFAHVYTCTIDPPFHGNKVACLKRVVVPNKLQLSLLRQEVDAMKRLRGNKHIVSYIDSHASRLPLAKANDTQQYEVLLLMEYCSKNGLIDFMNTRLTHRLTEPEVLSIMSQITTGVAMCHQLHPPLIHRDIKIENVLIDDKGTYKLCDFGSAVPYAPVPQTPQELNALHSDLMQHTTPQYRAPEMIDLTHGFPIDDKSDIWALGIFLYKLCYYTTPFESPHQKSLADLEQSILNCNINLRFPGSPQYSNRLQNVIHCCLRADPRRRPNALQLLQEVCSMQGVKQIPETVPYSVRISKTVPISYDYTSVNNDSTSQTQVLQATIPQKAPAKAATSDVFASIDKTKILSMGSNHKKPDLPRRPSGRSHNSSTTLHDMIKKQVDDSSTELNNYRKSEDIDRSTLDFLKSKEDVGISSRQSTGGSIKASLKKGLRRISTGGSVSSQRSGSNDHKRHSSSSSIRKLFTGSKEKGEGIEDRNHLRVPSQEKKVSSIQKRMSLLLNNSEQKAPKTASGYGKYTDQDDISAINYTDLSASVSADSLVTNESSSTEELHKLDSAPSRPSVSKTPSDKRLKSKSPRKYSTPPPRQLSPSKSASTTKLNTPSKKPDLVKVDPKIQAGLVRKPVSLKKSEPEKKSESEEKSKPASETKSPKKPAKRPPPKPFKPKHLTLPEQSRRLSNSSDTSIPDVEDLEKSFAKRFPSYV